MIKLIHRPAHNNSTLADQKTQGLVIEGWCLYLFCLSVCLSAYVWMQTVFYSFCIFLESSTFSSHQGWRLCHIDLSIWLWLSLLGAWSFFAVNHGYWKLSIIFLLYYFLLYIFLWISLNLCFEEKGIIQETVCVLGPLSRELPWTAIITTWQGGWSSLEAIQLSHPIICCKWNCRKPANRVPRDV